MIQKNSMLKPCDNCGVLKTKVFQVYKGSKGKLAFVGDFLKVSCRSVKPDNPVKKKSKLRGIFIRSIFNINRKDGSFISFKKNSAVLLKKRLTPKGKSIRGPISRNIRRKKFVSSFKRSI